ncbi:MAG: GNAT family N-acetyltransferase [Myxococcota bacterium]
MRQALPKDRDTLVAFHRALYLDHRSSLMGPQLERLYAYRLFEEVLVEDVDAMLRNPATAILIAEESREPVGYISGYVETDRRRVLSRKGIVGDWYVLASRRGEGVGRKLLDALLAIFRESGCNVAEIATWPVNHGTRRHIEAAGFEEIQIVYRQALDDD